MAALRSLVNWASLLMFWSVGGVLVSLLDMLKRPCFGVFGKAFEGVFHCFAVAVYVFAIFVTGDESHIFSAGDED